MKKASLRIFCSYAREDKHFVEELKKHLLPLQMSGLIEEAWHDGCIKPGEEWDSMIKENLEKAQIILLLVSIDFLVSSYCNQVEIERAMRRHYAREAWVIPIIVRSCYWKKAPFAKLQVLPKNAEPVSKWSSLDDVFTEIVESIADELSIWLTIQEERLILNSIASSNQKSSLSDSEEKSQDDDYIQISLSDLRKLLS